MYISTNPGLGARTRRGFGAITTGPTGVMTVTYDRAAYDYSADAPSSPALPCCADAAAAAKGGCDDSCVAGSTSDQAILQMQQQIYNLQNRANAPAPVSGQWITGISNTVVGIGAAAFAGLLFMKAMR